MEEKYLGSERHIANYIAAGKKGNEVLRLKKEQIIKDYYENPKLCLACGEAIPYEKKRENKYCNNKCRAAQISPTKGRKRTEEEKIKISNSLSGRTLSEEHKQNLSNTLNEFWHGKERQYYPRKNNTELKRLKKEKSPKEKLSKEELSKKMSIARKKYFEEHPEAREKIAASRKGTTNSAESKKKISDKVKIRIANGTHNGWSSRNKPSYPELFFMEVLKNNNINYEFEKKVGKYFIDFAIVEKMIALEIDGKQHKLIERAQKDKEKDNFLTGENWKVYRIQWKQINTQIGKDYIKKEIQKFIEFYNSIN